MDNKRNTFEIDSYFLSSPINYKQISNTSTPTTMNETKRSNLNINKTLSSTFSRNKKNCMNYPLLFLSYFCAFYSTVS
jgi:hypothetical protein